MEQGKTGTRWVEMGDDRFCQPELNQKKMGKGWVQDIVKVEWMELGDKLNVEEAVNDKIQASDPCNLMVVPIHPNVFSVARGLLATEKTFCLT